MSNFGAIPTNYICRFKEITKMEIIVVCQLYAFRNRKSGVCNPSQKAIALATGIGKSHVSTALKGLGEKGWIDQEKDGNYLLDLLSEKVPDSGTSERQNEDEKVTESATDEFRIREPEVPDSGTKVTDSGTQSSEIGNSYIKDLNTERTQNEQSIEHTENPAVKCAVYVGSLTAQITERLNLKTLPNKIVWEKAFEWAFNNDFSSDHVLECFDLMKDQHWRKGPITPKSLSDNLPNIENLRSEVLNQNGKNSGNNRNQSEREKSAARNSNGRAFADELERQGLAERAARQGLLGDGTSDGTEIDQPGQLAGTH